MNGGNDGGCVSAAEWDAFKQDMMREMRQQLNQIKKEILDGMTLFTTLFIACVAVGNDPTKT